MKKVALVTGASSGFGLLTTITLARRGWSVLATMRDLSRKEGLEAAAKAGIGTVLIPRMNMGDVLIEERYKSLVTIIPVDTIDDVLKFALVPENSDGFLTKLKKMAIRSTAMIAEAEVPPVNKTTA